MLSVSSSICYFALFVLGSVLCTNSRSSLLDGDIQLDDVKKIQQFFEENIREMDDTKIFHALIGMSSIGVSPKHPDKLCKAFSKIADTVTGTYHRVCGANILGTICKVPSDKIQGVIKNSLSDTMTAEELYEVVMIHKCASLTIDTPKVLQILDKIKAKDQSPFSLAFVIQIASQLDLKTMDAKRYAPLMTAVLDQADEIDNNKLYYDRGLYTTAMVTIGIFDFINKHGAVETIPENQLTKLLNLVILRRKSYNLRAAAYLRKALKSASENRILTPIVFKVIKAGGDVQIATGGELPIAKPTFQLQLATMLGDPITGTSVSLTAHGLHSIPDGNLVGPSERGQFVYDKASATFQLHLATSDGQRPPRGHYFIDLDAKWSLTNESRVLLGASTVRVPLRIVADASVASSRIAVIDAAHGRHVTEIVLKPGAKHSTSAANGAISVDTDHQARLTIDLIETSVTGTKGEATPLVAHQVFVQLTHQLTKQTITVICKQASSSAGKGSGSRSYELLLDPKRSAADFDNLSGVYKMELFVGDSLISKPLNWYLADLELNFDGVSGDESRRKAASAQEVSRQRLASAAAAKAANVMAGAGPSRPKPSIEHVFRPSEKRAPSLIARGFTIACALPLLGLLVAWTTIGINLGNFRFRLSGLIFHIGLICIFCLYYIYWCYLDMFTTIGYLAVISVPTFLAGNRLLRDQLVLHSSASKR